MAYKYSGRIIRTGKSWVDNDGIQHPANWMVWDDATKAAKGLVWEDDPDNSFDGRFYWSAGVAKALDDVTEEDGTITKGLKSNAIATVKAQAAGLLAPTDWYVVRKSETDVAIPATIATFRAAVRTASGTIEAAITAAADLDAFMALYDAPEDGNAPINDWPEEV
jgi:hypothetical protein